MKKLILAITLSSALLLAACGGTTEVAQPQITSDIEQQVFAISEGSEDYSISEVEDDGHIYRINIELLFEPKSYAEVEGCTASACVNCQDIFSQAGIKRDISVWARRTLPNNKVALYGRTYYSQTTGKYEFKNIKELNL